MLSDFHIHSTCSSDAHDTMSDMANAAFERGVSVMCFTDHVDLDDYETGLPADNCLELWAQIKSEYAKVLKTAPKGLEVKLGIELGEAHHDLALAKEISAAAELDFVIGSLHNLRNTPDFSMIRYISMADCKQYLAHYVEELLELAALDCYDVMAHIGYTRRYMLRDGFDLKLGMKNYGDELSEVFRILIANGRGIEMNCSGLRNAGIHDTIPSFSVIRRYRELGGEIITVGSDAHCTADAGVGNARGLELLAEAGFEYYTIFRNRKPEFIKL